MKRDPKAIDEIETLDEAKEILKMITGNIYLSGKFTVYSKIICVLKCQKKVLKIAFLVQIAIVMNMIFYIV